MIHLYGLHWARTKDEYAENLTQGPHTPAGYYRLSPQGVYFMTEAGEVFAFLRGNGTGPVSCRWSIDRKWPLYLRYLALADADRLNAPMLEIDRQHEAKALAESLYGEAAVTEGDAHRRSDKERSNE
jgi:hypothetical protein